MCIQVLIMIISMRSKISLPVSISWLKNWLQRASLKSFILNIHFTYNIMIFFILYIIHCFLYAHLFYKNRRDIVTTFSSSSSASV